MTVRPFYRAWILFWYPLATPTEEIAVPIRHKSIKMVRKDRLKKFFDRRLIEALHHPVREHVLAVTNERVASMVEIGDEIGLDVVAFNKQVKVLEELGYIELVGTRPARGGTEHFYRARTTVLFDDRAWEDVPASLKADLGVGIVQSILDDVVGALRGGTFRAREDKHTSWMPVVLDRRGWREAMKLLDATLMRLVAIQRQSGLRIMKSGEPGIPATIAMLGFETRPEFTGSPGRRAG